MANCMTCGRQVTGGLVVCGDCAPRWVNVKERLPDNNSVVLAYCVGTAGNGNCSLVASCDNGFWFLQKGDARLGYPNLKYEVTHWMPLPKPPRRG